MNQDGVFLFKKHPQVNFHLIETLSGLNPQLIIFVLLWIDLIEENGQNQAKERFCFEVYVLTSFLSFMFLISFLIMFPCFVGV